MLTYWANFRRIVKLIPFNKPKYCSNGRTVKSVRSMYEQKEKHIDGSAWFLLVIPVATFGLGTWQVQRKRWKEQIISELSSRTSLPPVDLPYDLSELESMEFHSVRVVGTFDHSKEMYMGPRSLLQDGESASSGRTIISQGQTGYLVVTPFDLADRDTTILINRGWVPHKKKAPNTRLSGQVTGEVELVGVVRLKENRPPFTSYNTPGSNLWMFRDLERMAETVGSEAVFLDADEASSVPGGPIGGQTRVSLRNEHLSYIFTWYGLTAATAFMWYRHFIAGIKSV